MPTVALSEEQKVKVRHHLGYPNVSQAATFALGVPAFLEISFILEGAMNKLLPASRPELERVLGILDVIEQQKVDDLELLAVVAVGEISINIKEQQELTRQYDYWVSSLSNILTAPRNPFDARLTSGGNSINARVAR